MAYGSKKSGFAPVELVVIVGVLAVMGIIGYTFYSRINNQPTAQTDQSSPQVSDEQAPEINQLSDLQKAEEAMDEAEILAENDQEQVESLPSDF